MSDAPERIWAQADMDGAKRYSWHRGMYDDDPQDAVEWANGAPVQEYVHAGIHDAVVAERDEARAEVARLREALEPLADRAASAAVIDCDRFNFGWMVEKARAALRVEGKE